MAAAWPYPRWIAHRGAGRLAPENTLSAFALGHAQGYRMFECDVRLSADGLPFLLHDDRLERTTDGVGEALALTWAELARLDAGGWHSPRCAGERLPTLGEAMAFCARHDCALNLELKPAPGDARRTGAIVAAEIVREKLFRYLGEELPYEMNVEVEAFEVDGHMFRIHVAILVDKEGQKPIVIGRGGEKLKKISTEARLDMEQLFDCKVFLEVWVKVKSGWADDVRFLRDFGLN